MKRFFYSHTEIIGIIYFLILGSGLVVCVCTGFALISDNTPLKLKFAGITIIELVFLYYVCWLAEETAKESSSIGDVTYDVDWWTLPKECQSTLRIMMTHSTTRPLIMKTFTGQIVDLACYMSLIKASYSYFNMMLVATQ